MGLKTKDPVTFVRMKNGKFYDSRDKEFKTPFDELEGVITGIRIREDEYEGKPFEKLQITINDGVEDYVIGTGFNTSYTSSLIGFLKNADLTKPLTLVPTLKVEGKEQRQSILVKQDGKWCKAFYTKDNPNGQPKITKVLVNGKPFIANGREQWDKEEFLAFFRNVVKELSDTIVGNVGDTIKDSGGDKFQSGGDKWDTKGSTETPYVNQTTEDDIADDLPF